MTEGGWRAPVCGSAPGVATGGEMRDYMRNLRVQRLLAVVGAVLAGASMAPGVLAECLLSGGVATAAGCTRDSGEPDWWGECSGAPGGDCYECQYQCPNGETQNCAEHADGGFQFCVSVGGDPSPPDVQEGGEATPILIDLDTNGFHLDGLERTVPFDLSGVGVPGLYSWTSADSGDAFLCRDRDGNGRIENGRELFGNATLLAGGARARHGYEALRELDLLGQGGNQDGRLTAEDFAFQELCVWVDEDHDGVSDPGEVLALWEAGVIEPSYEFHESRRRDAHGNQFRFQGSAVLANPRGQPRHSST